MNAKQQKQQQEFETDVVEGMTKAVEIATEKFGAQSNLYGEHEIYEYLDVAEDEEEFLADLDRTIAHAKVVHKTLAPTPEQTFKLFEKLFKE